MTLPMLCLGSTLKGGKAPVTAPPSSATAAADAADTGTMSDREPPPSHPAAAAAATFASPSVTAAVAAAADTTRPPTASRRRVLSSGRPRRGQPPWALEAALYYQVEQPPTLLRQMPLFLVTTLREVPPREQCRARAVRQSWPCWQTTRRTLVVARR